MPNDNTLAASIDESSTSTAKPWVVRSCWLAFLIGAVWRYHYIGFVHPASAFIYSDMKAYCDEAMHLLDSNYTHSIANSIYPPGMFFFLAGTYAISNSWTACIVAQLVLSLCVPLLIYAIGYDLFGKPAALFGLAVSSLYFAFIDYAAYFLAENPFLFCLLLGVWLLVRSLRVRNTTWACALGLLCGLALGAATSFKSMALMTGLLLGLYLLWMGVKFRWRRILFVSVAGLVGLLLLLVPMSLRATRLAEGRFTLVSTNGPMNFLYGHYGMLATFTFRDRKRGYAWIWASPATLQKGWSERADFDFGPYETDKVKAAAWKWIREHPLDALLLSTEHVFDLVTTVPWPTSHTAWRHWMVLSEQLFKLFVLLPACFYLVANRRALFQPTPATFGDWIVLLPLVSIAVVAFLYFGDPRYRIPYDGFAILLAARWYTGGRARPDGLLPAGLETRQQPAVTA